MLFAIPIIIVMIGAIMLVRYQITPEETKILKSLYSLDKNIDAKGLEKKGYINVTEVKKENPEITHFLKALGGDYRKATLRVFTDKDGELTVKVYSYDPKWKLIGSWTYLPNSEVLNAPVKIFSRYYETVADGDVKSVKLINVSNLSHPEITSLSDEILYSYYKK